MSEIKMKKFGLILTGREYGVNAAEQISKEFSPPFIFDFTGVLSMGSSFGDEIFKMASKVSKDNIKVINENNVIRAAISQVANDLGIKVDISGI